MYRATTPKHTFIFPWATSGLNWALITYAQDGQNLLTKNLSACTRSGNNLEYTLTETETKLFVEGMVEVQVRCGRTSSESLASNVIKMPCWKVLNDTSSHS